MIEFSEIQNIYFILPLLGFIIGLFGTMVGGGGGFFFLPILTLIIMVPAQTAVITSLVAALPICIVGSLGHYRKKHIDLRVAALFMITGITGAFIGAEITSRISDLALKTAFGVYSVLIALNMVFSARKNKGEKERENTRISFKSLKTVKGSFFGLAAGLITGTFGTSGTAPVLAGLFSMRIPFRMVIGTSLLIVLVNTIFAVGAHFIVGKIDLTLVVFLTAGSAIGAVIGPRLLAKVQIDKSESKAKYVYAIIMAAIGVLMILGRN
ncbi:sulfite exporter TauE/SafE family protein [Maribellus maritimus]|uniref:sulfite exporter TauE/SafE family protein n=1 Tax=Maribellus maritimus TaxID=2870838 RepID=UPI001EEB06AA|nr:sulfite exporter TauE/SafE family protein [Maribellus maritimus]MCG6190395.1 sulfite exporter TauE/SafE family protein [Maribellus maritimus]